MNTNFAIIQGFRLKFQQQENDHPVKIPYKKLKTINKQETYNHE